MVQNEKSSNYITLNVIIHLLCRTATLPSSINPYTTIPSSPLQLTPFNYYAAATLVPCANNPAIHRSSSFVAATIPPTGLAATYPLPTKAATLLPTTQVAAMANQTTDSPNVTLTIRLIMQGKVKDSFKST